MVVVRQGKTAGGFNLAASAFDNVLWDYINKLDCSVTTISENENQFQAIYPNPVTTILNIDNINQNIYKVDVYDIYGRLIYSSTKNESIVSIDFKSFTKGVYVVQLQNNNKEVVRRKVVKE
jgi:hypothetical protein